MTEQRLGEQSRWRKVRLLDCVNLAFRLQERGAKQLTSSLSIGHHRKTRLSFYSFLYMRTGRWVRPILRHFRSAGF